jgi:hypothetical protein
VNFDRFKKYIVPTGIAIVAAALVYVIYQKHVAQTALANTINNPLASASTDQLFMQSGIANTLFGSTASTFIGGTASGQPAYNAAENFGLSSDLGGSSNVPGTTTTNYTGPLNMDQPGNPGFDDAIALGGYDL